VRTTARVVAAEVAASFAASPAAELPDRQPAAALGYSVEMNTLFSSVLCSSACIPSSLPTPDCL
jgi:hypothetical protein